MNEAEFSIHTPTDNVLELDQAVLRGPDTLFTAAVTLVQAGKKS